VGGRPVPAHFPALLIRIAGYTPGSRTPYYLRGCLDSPRTKTRSATGTGRSPAIYALQPAPPVTACSGHHRRHERTRSFAHNAGPSHKDRRASSAQLPSSPL